MALVIDVCLYAIQIPPRDVLALRRIATEGAPEVPEACADLLKFT